jgi:hypothetical protein
MNPRIVIVPLDNTEVTEAHGVKQRYGDERYMIHNTTQPDLRATLALQFAERWAMVAAEADGEDSAGRQKMRRLEPGELAQHACDCVTALFLQFEDRKWLLKVPSFDEVMASLNEQEEQPPGGPSTEAKP